MKFYELRKKEAFSFKSSPDLIFYCAGVDGAFGRYVEADGDVGAGEQWEYCGPNDAVIRRMSPEHPGEEFSQQSMYEAAGGLRK